MMLLIPGVLFNDLIADMRFFEANLPLDIERPKNFVDVGDLVLSRQDPIVTVKVANHQILRVSALLLEVLLIAILKQFLVILPAANEQDELQDHDSLAAEILEILLMLVIIWYIQDDKGEMIE